MTPAAVDPAAFYTYVVGAMFLLVLFILAAGAVWGGYLWVRARLRRPVVDAEPCSCSPCRGRGNDGHGLSHCAECCFGTGVEEYDPGCPRLDHRAMAARQSGAPYDWAAEGDFSAWEREMTP